ncbi:putrescine ABC transporter permease PotH, partial [Xanthomonas perforans]|nr:putrescine ABC transporter permease PotH [Xanthomonas perforans]
MLATLSRGLPGARWGVIAAPYLWLLVFFAIPFLIVLKISFAERATAMPPYT